MRLVGYIKKQKSNSFAIPIYSGKEREFFFHTLDECYNIIGFTTAQLNNTTFKKLYLSKKFEIDSKGAVVFIGKEGYIKYDDAENAVNEIINYIKDSYTFETAETLLEEAIVLQETIFKDVSKKGKVVTLHPKKEQSILAFDFPLARKEPFIKNNKQDNSKENKQEKSSRILKLEQISDPAFKSEIKRLNALEKNYEIMLKMRSEDRRSKLKAYNYQFHFSQKEKMNTKMD